MNRAILKHLRSIVGVTWLAGSSALAADSPPATLKDVTDLTLDQLVNIQVTSVSKKETPLTETPAAVTVITQEDIRRSGLTSVPELLRLVPGVEVAQINASEWAVSVRGFNGQYANKLLVMVDGRSIYNAAFAFVRWDVQDLVLEDIERIEVIRGPGATLWGANAVNGVINIITKSAKETQGGLVSATVGTEEKPSTSVRYGGQLGTNLFYRAYLKYVDHDRFVDSMGNASRDNWNAMRGGVRLDWDATESDRLTLEGEYYAGAFGQPTETPILTAPYRTNFTAVDDSHGGNILGRWTREFSDGSELTLQAYYDHAVMYDSTYRGVVDTFDFDLQHKFDLGSRQQIIWGAGYRYTPTYNSDSSFINWTRLNRDDQLFSAFAQDDVTLIEKRLHFIAGTKIEHNDYTGFEFEPSGRLLWTPDNKQTVWAAVSRAVRTPAEFERDSIYSAQALATPSGLPALVQVSGNPNFHSEKVLTYELGYRVQPTPRLSFDATAFYASYDSLELAQSAGAPFFVASPTPHLVIPELYANAESAQNAGFEIAAQWNVTDDWKLAGSYSLLKEHLRPNLLQNSDSPENQFQIHSYYNLPCHVELNAGVYYVDHINPLSTATPTFIHSYVRLDVGVSWRPCKSLEIGLWGQNLLSDYHAEFPSSRTSFQTEIPRSVVGKVTLKF